MPIPIQTLPAVDASCTTSALHGDPPSASSPQGAADRGELALIAMERTRMPMVVTDPRQPDNPIVLANHAFLKETGYGADEVIGRNCRFLQAPDTDPAAIAQVRDALRREEEILIEVLNLRKDGTPFWNQLYISPIHDDEGRLLYFFASQMDTTKRRQAQELEAAERRLLLEIDHRAKNALALVQGIVRLSNRKDPDLFADAVQGRVDALARAHSTLAEGRWRSVPLERIVRGEVEPLGKQRVRIAGDPVELTSAQVQPVALLLHEFAANARRHGAFSNADGTLRVEWERDAAGGEVHLRWRESGGPPPPSTRVPGYGHMMIQAIARRQLRGRVDYAWDAPGLVATVAFPLGDAA